MTVLQFPDPDPRSMDERVTEEVRGLMGRHRVTQLELAGWLGLSQAATSDRLNNKSRWTVEHLERVAEAFGKHPAELMGGYPASGPSGPTDGAVPIKRGRPTVASVDRFTRRRLVVPVAA